MKENRRNADPISSYEAADYMEVSGIQMKMIDRVVGMVTNTPDHTGKELCKHYGFADTSVVLKRLSDTVRKGLIFKGDYRKCTVTGLTVVTYYVTENE